MYFTHNSDYNKQTQSDYFQFFYRQVKFVTDQQYVLRVIN